MTTANLERLNYSDDDLTDIAVEVVLAMMTSVSTETIQPINWWPRAKSALSVAAVQAESWSQFISKMGQKLQINTLRKKSSLKVVGLRVPDEYFPRFRTLCQRDSLYIVAMAQAERDRRRKDGN